MRKQYNGKEWWKKFYGFAGFTLLFLFLCSFPGYSNHQLLLPAFLQEQLPVNLTSQVFTVETFQPNILLFQYFDVSSHPGDTFSFNCLLCSAIAIISLTFLIIGIFWMKRTKKKYFTLKHTYEELLNHPPDEKKPDKELNGFSLKGSNFTFRLRDCIFIKNHERMMKISLKDILYIKADRNYCCLHTKEKEYLVVMPLKELNKKLPSKQFLRIHRSFIINLSQIDEIGTGHVVIARKTVPLSKTSKEELLKHLQTI